MTENGLLEKRLWGEKFELWETPPAERSNLSISIVKKKEGEEGGTV